MSNYLDELNPVQLQAVQHVEGPLMIIAGAGSGKTRVLTYRTAYLIEHGIDPFNILALTFTNKAAAEMRQRIESIVGHEARNIWMGTFHSVFARILRREAEKLGFPNNFSIYDTDDSKSMIKLIVKEQGLNEKLYKPNIVFNRISSAKNSLITPKMYAEDYDLRSADESTGRPKIALLYELYWKRCFQAGAMDFDDLLFKMYLLLEKFPEALHKYQHYFHFILIDEYQDTNFAQYAITKKLAAANENICVVGDDAQSIYGFRGANIQNILNFEVDYPDLKVYKLEQNYRSTQNILNAANDVIGKNKKQINKKLWTANVEGEKIKLMKSASDNDEGRIVADSIFETKMRHHLRNQDYAILYRTNAQSRSFEEALRRLNIPYRVYGGISFYQRKEIKDLLAYLRITMNPKDEEALRRVINYPARGIGKTTLEKITVIANEQGVALWEVLENIGLHGFTARTRSAIDGFVTMIKSFMIQANAKTAYELAEHIARSSGILKELYSDKSVEGLARYENIQELLNGIKEFTEQKVRESEDQVQSGLGAYLQEISLLTNLDEDDENEDKVKLMTLHSAKGLEFPFVYIVGLEENLFPSNMALNSREDLEEERRLFYVGITRAEKKLFLSYANTRYRFGNLIYCEPSRFLDEISPDYLEAVAMPRQRSEVPSSAASHRENIREMRARQLAQNKTTHQTSANFKADDPNDIQTGMEVEHQRFGFGKVVSVEGTMPNKIATVFFQGEGQKKIMLKYAKLSIKGKKEIG